MTAGMYCDKASHYSHRSPAFSLMQITVSAGNFFSPLDVLPYIFIRFTSGRRSIFWNVNSQAFFFFFQSRGDHPVFPLKWWERSSPPRRAVPRTNPRHSYTENLSGSFCHSRWKFFELYLFILFFPRVIWSFTATLWYTGGGRSMIPVLCREKYHSLSANFKFCRNT